MATVATPPTEAQLIALRKQVEDAAAAVAIHIATLEAEYAANSKQLIR
jgi:hypothetical protein